MQNECCSLKFVSKICDYIPKRWNVAFIRVEFINKIFIHHIYTVHIILMRLA